MCNSMAHNISGWEAQSKQKHVQLICHLLCGFRKKKTHEHVHLEYKLFAYK